jgi:hypothetical protein
VVAPFGKVARVGEGRREEVVSMVIMAGMAMVMPCVALLLGLLGHV